MRNKNQREVQQLQPLHLVQELPGLLDDPEVLSIRGVLRHPI